MIAPVSGGHLPSPVPIFIGLISCFISLMDENRMELNWILGTWAVCAVDCIANLQYNRTRNTIKFFSYNYKIRTSSKETEHRNHSLCMPRCSMPWTRGSGSLFEWWMSGPETSWIIDVFRPKRSRRTLWKPSPCKHTPWPVRNLNTLVITR